LAAVTQAGYERFLVLQHHPRSAVAEAYRSLRTALQFLPREKQRSLVVTSAGPGEGKTTCAVNLALSLASAGRRVLLVDGDMRRPMLHRIFGLGKTIGLSHALSGQAQDGFIQETDVPGLEVVPCGTLPPNPTELLGQSALGILLARWQEQYDHVLFDSPPLLGLADALILARQVGRAVVVVQSSRTEERHLRHAAAQLRDGGVEVLGAVLNGVLPRDAPYGYGYYPYGGEHREE
jgi:capsular exopolysaccharide synthesis family protein